MNKAASSIYALLARGAYQMALESIHGIRAECLEVRGYHNPK